MNTNSLSQLFSLKYSLALSFQIGSTQFTWQLYSSLAERKSSQVVAVISPSSLRIRSGDASVNARITSGISCQLTFETLILSLVQIRFVEYFRIAIFNPSYYC